MKPSVDSRLADSAPDYGQAKKTILNTLTKLPFVTPGQLQLIYGLQGHARLYKHLDSLREEGLINSITAAAPFGRPPAHLYLTDRGLSAAADGQTADVKGLVRRLGLDEKGLRKLIPRLPLLDALYGLLGSVVEAHEGCPRLVQCERPYWRRFRPRLARERVTAQLPLAVTVVWNDQVELECLLLPDLGVVSPRNHRRLISRLMELRRVLRGELPVLIIRTAPSCQTAWQNVIQDEATRRGEPRLPVVIVSDAAGTTTELRTELLPWICTASNRGVPKPVRRRPRAAAADPPHSLGTELSLDDLSQRLLKLLPEDRKSLWHAGRLPGTTITDLNVLEGRPAYEACRRLFDLKFLRIRPLVSCDFGKDKAEQLDTLELTADGVVAVAGQSVLPIGVVRRHLVGSQRLDDVKGERRKKHALETRKKAAPDELLDARQDELEKRPFHTRGSIWPATDLLLQARDKRLKKGWDDVLLDWQSEVFACHGLLRPDGYIQYRHWANVCAAFIEFDCGTENNGQLRRKFGRYHEYFMSGAFRRDFDGFPTILVITTSERAEERIARLVRQVEGGRPGRLPLLLTHYKLLLQGHTLGEVWWAPGTPQTERRCWFDITGAGSLFPSRKAS